MFTYYIHLALRSFRRNRVLTTLMVLTIALGIGACMTTLTVFHVLSGDPIPGKSDRLFYVQLDPRPLAGFKENEEPLEQVTRFDAEELLRQKQAKRQAMMVGGAAVIEHDDSALKPFSEALRYTSADFFAMFDVPFLYGQSWSASEDERHARVTVIAKSLNDKLFNGADSVGKTIRVKGAALSIIGVLDEWAPKPKFYDLNTGHYSRDEQVFIPFSTAMELTLGTEGSSNCFVMTPIQDPSDINAPCVWIQYWAELGSALQASDYKVYLDNYSAQQKSAGRFERAPNTRLRNVMSWLNYKQVIPGDVRLQLWLAFGFLLVCLVNTVGLLLAKFLRRSGEIGVRRALGASRIEIFKQCLVEAGSIGLVGGVLGLGVALLGLWAIRHRPTGYAALAHLDITMLWLTFALALLASLLAGLLPAWRAMQITPAMQLKSQ